MSEIKTKIRTYNDVIDLFGEEKAADMLSEALLCWHLQKGTV